MQYSLLKGVFASKVHAVHIHAEAIQWEQAHSN